MVHACNPSNWEAEAGVFLSSRSALSTALIPGQPELHRETLSRKQKQKNKTKQNQNQNQNQKKFSGDILESLKYAIISSANSDTLTYSLLIFIPLTYICCLFDLDRTSNTMVNR